MHAYRITPTTRLILRRGDITTFVGDAVVNAANERLLPGGGVCGAIHRAAGEELRAACLRLPANQDGIRCSTGQAQVTSGHFGSLKVQHVIHAVGPVYQNDATSAPLLRGAWMSSLALANDCGAKTVAFPAISCGIFGYPVGPAARVAMEACQEGSHELVEVHVYLFSPSDLSTWVGVADDMFPPDTRAVE